VAPGLPGPRWHRRQHQGPLSRRPHPDSGPPPPGWLSAALQAAGFSGDLTTGKIEPLPAASSSSGDGSGSGQDAADAAGAGLLAPEASAARRRAALLSLPLAAPPRDDGGLFGWASAAAWTPSGTPPPQPLTARQVPAERAAVAALLARLEARVAALPTTVETDAELLTAVAAAAAGKAGGGGGLPPRREAAVRARLEHKLLLAEAATLLRRYSGALARG
jgi:hypothetical protein